MTVIAEALRVVRDRIAVAAASAGRDPAEVALVAVAKGVTPARVAEAMANGAHEIGENRVQELLEKQEALGYGGGGPADAARWHLVGALQTNKARRVVGRVALIHSIDSERLARAVGARAEAAAHRQDVLLEVNASGEATKRGVAPGDVEAAAARLASVPGVRLRGLMTIAAPGSPGAARAAFRALRELRDRLVRRLPDARELSMGMSDDLEPAVEEGATIVRVGTAIFGPPDPG